MRLHVTRRAFTHGALFGAMAALAPQSVRRPAIALDDGAFGAACLGFGCNAYGDQDFNGLAAADAKPGSMPYMDFLQAIREKRVLAVDFIGPDGDEAYALVKDAGGKTTCNSYYPNQPIIDGRCRLRMGEGWPVESSAGWSSPMWVVRILKNEDIPYTFTYDLKIKPKRYAGYSPYVPSSPIRIAPPPGTPGGPTA
mmetsp:Transcript_30416/g.50345  ORF Transcript_30416/g.50345 Transcript_30416/m.50345 type:complete len:196 (-) Transcript_30416:31-618(-)|eukprot:CAMPEP_0119316076 /NCGR_PEP_ID=MMETSP1333-20130426/38446_1 /TAXON_ID=418940 /ORGANISM="Scyphosphaera apsteinii, Strain RCC1455" /LENGTH=195 /DNA_ID=CAMNT_0007321625 /DNA_START=25 /DNA_END=612 /DNA_ORIENTATION=+